MRFDGEELAVSDLLLGSIIGAIAGSLATVYVTHVIREVERDRSEVFQPIYRKMVQLSRLSHLSMASIPQVTNVCDGETGKIEEEGKLLPRRHKGLKSDLDKLQELGRQVGERSSQLRFDIQIEVHCELSAHFDELGPSSIDASLDDFLRSELLEAFYHGDSHRMKTLPFRASRHEHFKGDRKALEELVAKLTADVESTMAGDREETTEMLKTFLLHTQSMKTNLERVLKHKGYVRYRPIRWQ
jgi:hypothetical protein